MKKKKDKKTFMVCYGENIWCKFGEVVDVWVFF